MGAVVEIWLHCSTISQILLEHTCFFDKPPVFKHPALEVCSKSLPISSRPGLTSNDGRIELTPGLVDLLCLCTRLEVLSERNW